MGKFWNQVKLAYKVRKSIFIIKMYFKVFYLLRENLYIHNLYILNNIRKQFSGRILYKRGSRADMWHIYRRILMQKCDFNTFEVTLLYGCSPANCLNYSYNIFLEKHHWVTASVYMKVNAAYAGGHAPNQS